MSLPESTPGQTKWVCLILAVALGIVGLLPALGIGQALITGRARVYDRLRPTDSTVVRSEEPARFQLAIRRLSEPVIFFGGLAVLNLYFYRRLRD